MNLTIRMLVLAAVVSLATVVPTVSAQADPPLVQNYSCPIPGSTASLPVNYTELINTEKTVTVPDGTPLPGGFIAHSALVNGQVLPATLTQWRYVTQVTNLNPPGNSITSAENGPNWVTYDQTTTPGAVVSFTQIDTGNNVNRFGPRSRAMLAAKGIRVPALAYTSGLLVLHAVVTPDGTLLDNLTLNGRMVDGCALLESGGS
jgi:hypothetical protein